MMQVEPDEYYSATQAANLIQCSPSTIMNHIKNGKLETKKAKTDIAPFWRYEMLGKIVSLIQERIANRYTNASKKRYGSVRKNSNHLRRCR